MPRSDAILPAGDIPRTSPTGNRHRVGLLLIADFSLLSFAAVIEPLRAANRLIGNDYYDWCHVSPDGAAVTSSSGVAIAADHRLGDQLALDTLFVFAGGNPAVFNHEPTFSCLRALARRGVRIGGVSGGPYVLARAGLLDGYRCTIHWEHLPAFREEFPRLDPSRVLYEIDRDRMTCAGGIAALDLMRAQIAEDLGPAAAVAVSEWFLQTQLRAGNGPQRLTLRERYGTASPRLLAVLKLMESRLDEPASRAEMAEIAKVSIRQLERLFAVHLGTTIADHYTNIRLDRARALVHETAMPVLQVAVACGFVSASHFSRAYKHRFGLSPRNERMTERQRRQSG
ncbi:MAG TPA: GlxA family transcriptional regulator [Xanthobacteraceae bacterium]